MSTHAPTTPAPLLVSNDPELVPPRPAKRPIVRKQGGHARGGSRSRSRSWSRGGATAAMLFGGTLGATSSLHAGGGGFAYGDLHFGTVTSLTIDIDGSWAAPYSSRPITSVDFSANAGPYTSMSGNVNASSSGNGYDWLADGATDLANPSNIYDRLSARTNFHDWYPIGQDPFPTIKNGFIEFVLELTSPVTITLSSTSSGGISGGIVQPGLDVTLDGTSIATGATLGVGTRTLRYTWTNFSNPFNQFGMFATLEATTAAVPGGGVAGLWAIAVAGAGRRRRRSA